MGLVGRPSIPALPTRATRKRPRPSSVARVRAETTDTVTRNAKKSYVDERWDMADAMREKAEAWRAQRKAQELAYLEAALAINAATSMEPAKAARAEAQTKRQTASALLRDRKKTVREQASADSTSVGATKAAIHDSIHQLKFVPDAAVKSLGKADAGRFKTFFAPRTPASAHRKAPFEVTL